MHKGRGKNEEAVFSVGDDEVFEKGGGRLLGWGLLGKGRGSGAHGGDNGAPQRVISVDRIFVE